LLLNLSALYDFKLSRTTKANVELSFWDLLDKKNIINAFYILNNGETNEINQRSLGITPNVVFRINFLSVKRKYFELI